MGQKLISAIGVTVVSACFLQASDDEGRYRNRLGGICSQVVLQHMGNVKTDSDGHEVMPADIDAAKLNLIQTHRQFEELLDRQRINDAPITDKNEAQYSGINTQVIYNKTDKIIWDDDVTKYVIDAPFMINSSMERRILKPNEKLMYIDSLSSGNDFYKIYFIRDRDFLKDFTVNNSYREGINGGFFMFKLPRLATLYDFHDKVYSHECDEMSFDDPAYIFVDDRGVTSPVSNIKDATKISQPDVNKVLVRRVEFKKLRPVVGLFDAKRRDALQKVFDEVCGSNHGNRFMLDNATKRKMAVDVLEKGRQLIDIENEVTVGDCLNGGELTIAEKTAFSAILWEKIQSFRARNLSDSDKAEMADMATTIGLPMTTMPTLEDVLRKQFTVTEINSVVALLVRKAEKILNRSLTEDEKREISAIIARR